MTVPELSAESHRAALAYAEDDAFSPRVGMDVAEFRCVMRNYKEHLDLLLQNLKQKDAQIKQKDSLIRRKDRQIEQLRMTLDNLQSTYVVYNARSMCLVRVADAETDASICAVVSGDPGPTSTRAHAHVHPETMYVPVPQPQPQPQPQLCTTRGLSRDIAAQTEDAPRPRPCPRPLDCAGFVWVSRVHEENIGHVLHMLKEKDEEIKLRGDMIKLQNEQIKELRRTIVDFESVSMSVCVPAHRCDAHSKCRVRVADVGTNTNTAAVSGDPVPAHGHTHAHLPVMSEPQAQCEAVGRHAHNPTTNPCSYLDIATPTLAECFAAPVSLA